jgi:Ni,Fe-hydrogenase III large subunit
VKRLKAAERIRLDSARNDFSSQTEIQAALSAIQQSLQVETDRHAQTIKEICDRLDRLHQLLKDIPEN